MFKLNENNYIVMAQYSTDMRIGVNCFCGQARQIWLNPANIEVYIFRWS